MTEYMVTIYLKMQYFIAGAMMSKKLTRHVMMPISTFRKRSTGISI
jgi:hypothetical protein